MNQEGEGGKNMNHYNKFPLSQKYESRRGGGQKYEFQI